MTPEVQPQIQKGEHKISPAVKIGIGLALAIATPVIAVKTYLAFVDAINKRIDGRWELERAAKTHTLNRSLYF